MVQSKSFSPPLKNQEEQAQPPLQKAQYLPIVSGWEEFFAREVLIEAHLHLLWGCRARDMTVQRREVCLLNTRVCLLLAMYLWHWVPQTLATSCPSGELRTVAKDVKKCCPKCLSSSGKGTMRLSSFMCMCALGNYVCKTKPRGFPSCPTKFKMCFSFRADMHWRFMCLCFLLCSRKGTAGGSVFLITVTSRTPDLVVTMEEIGAEWAFRSIVIQFLTETSSHQQRDAENK